MAQPKNPELVEFNRKNKEFWDDQKVLMDGAWLTGLFSKLQWTLSPPRRNAVFRSGAR